MDGWSLRTVLGWCQNRSILRQFRNKSIRRWSVINKQYSH